MIQLLLEEALEESDQATLLNRGKVMMVGSDHVGKSATVCSLLGKARKTSCPKASAENLKEKIFEESIGAGKIVKRGEFEGRNMLLRLPQVLFQRMAGLFSSNVATTSTPIPRASIATSTCTDDSIDVYANENTQVPTAEVIFPKALKMNSRYLINKIWSNSKEKIALSIWDLSGQDMFCDLRSLFLTRHSVYSCVFDMRAVVLGGEKERAASIDFLKYLLRSIQMHAPGAPVFLVGTFKDAVPNAKTHEKISDILCSSLDLDKIAPTLVMNRENKLAFWPIDNTKGEADPVVVKLRQSIMERVEKMAHVSLKIPSSWMQVLENLMATKQRTITTRDVVNIASQNNITNLAYITGMLSLFHELGMLLHFSDTDELRGLVVLDPQWLVDNLRGIRDFKFHQLKDDLVSNIFQEIPEDFKRFKNEAIVSVALMNRLWESEDGYSETDFTRRKFLISLMKNLALSCVWHFKDEESVSTEESGQYLISSNLRLLREPEFESNIRTQMERICPARDLISNATSSTREEVVPPICFVVDLSLNFEPKRIFDRLICLLLVHLFSNFKRSCRPLLAKGSVVLSFDENVFRIDEDTEQGQIIVTIAEGSDRFLILRLVKFLLSKLQNEVMSYRILVPVWRNGEDNKPCLVDLEEARKKTKVKDVSDGTLVERSEYLHWISDVSVV